MTDEPFPPRRPLDVVIAEAHVTVHEFIEMVKARGPWPTALEQAVYAQLDMALTLWQIWNGDDAEHRDDLN